MKELSTGEGANRAQQPIGEHIADAYVRLPSRCQNGQLQRTVRPLPEVPIRLMAEAAEVLLRNEVHEGIPPEELVERFQALGPEAEVFELFLQARALGKVLFESAKAFLELTALGVEQAELRLECFQLVSELCVLVGIVLGCLGLQGGKLLRQDGAAAFVFVQA